MFHIVVREGNPVWLCGLNLSLVKVDIFKSPQYCSFFVFIGKMVICRTMWDYDRSGLPMKTSSSLFLYDF